MPIRPKTARLRGGPGVEGGGDVAGAGLTEQRDRQISKGSHDLSTPSFAEESSIIKLPILAQTLKVQG